MGRFKIKKRELWIDMTPMSDVMVLVLTFFMLTATFVKPEPVKVQTPGSVSSINVPDHDVLTILIDPKGRIFMSLDKKTDMMSTLDAISEKYNISFTLDEKRTFGSVPSFGVPINELKSFLDLDPAKREAYLSSESIKGIPCDSANNEFKDWVEAAREVNPDLVISIKSDANTKYQVVKTVMNSLQDIKCNRYNLITNLKKVKAVDE
jgi:biopolymer transport protein ExbD